MVKIRKAVAKDRGLIYEMLQQCDFLTTHEIELELSRIDQMLFDRRQDLFRISIAENENDVVGYASYGPESRLKGNYVIYNIIASPLSRGQIIEDILIQAIEAEIKKLGGKRVCIELPRDDNFETAKALYVKHEYSEALNSANITHTGSERSRYAKKMVSR